MFLLAAGDNAQDVARWWADPRVTEIVNAKFETIPQPKDGKKKKDKKGRGKSGSKKKVGTSRAHSVPPLPQGGMTQQGSGVRYNTVKHLISLATLFGKFTKTNSFCKNTKFHDSKLSKYLTSQKA